MTESAKEAVAKGSANHQELEIATHGVEVNRHGKLVPTSRSTQSVADGNWKQSVNGDESGWCKDRDREFALSLALSQDVSLHY